MMLHYYGPDNEQEDETEEPQNWEDVIEQAYLEDFGLDLSLDNDEGENE